MGFSRYRLFYVYYDETGLREYEVPNLDAHTRGHWSNLNEVLAWLTNLPQTNDELVLWRGGSWRIEFVMNA